MVVVTWSYIDMFDETKPNLQTKFKSLEQVRDVVPPLEVLATPTNGKMNMTDVKTTPMYIGQMHQPEFMEQTATQAITDSETLTTNVGNLETSDGVTDLNHTQNQNEHSVPSTERNQQDSNILEASAQKSAVDNTEDDTPQTTKNVVDE